MPCPKPDIMTKLLPAWEAGNIFYFFQKHSQFTVFRAPERQSTKDTIMAEVQAGSVRSSLGGGNEFLASPFVFSHTSLLSARRGQAVPDLCLESGTRSR